MSPKDMSAEELVRISVIGFCCYTPAECEEIEAELLSRLKDGERTVKTMEEVRTTLLDRGLTASETLTHIGCIVGKYEMTQEAVE